MLKISNIIFLLSAMLISSCSSLPYFEDLMLQRHAKEVYQNNPETILAAISSRKSRHSPYAKNGSALWLSTSAHYRDYPTALTGKQLLEKTYLPLVTIELNNIQLSVNYDSQLKCSEHDLTTWREELLNAFPAPVFQQFQQQYQINAHIVLKQSFYHQHRIDPQAIKLNFYQPAECKDFTQTAWRVRLLEIIAHEITHIEQHWTHHNYKKLVEFPSAMTKNTPNAYRLLNEYLASKVGICAKSLAIADNTTPEQPLMRLVITDAKSHSPQLALNTAGAQMLKTIDYNTVDITDGFYSLLGEQLAEDWLATYADEDGFIFHNIKTNNNFISACQTILSDEAIKAAATKISLLLAH